MKKAVKVVRYIVLVNYEKRKDRYRVLVVVLGWKIKGIEHICLIILYCPNMWSSCKMYPNHENKTRDLL